MCFSFHDAANVTRDPTRNRHGLRSECTNDAALVHVSKAPAWTVGVACAWNGTVRGLGNPFDPMDIRGRELGIEIIMDAKRKRIEVRYGIQLPARLPMGIEVLVSRCRLGFSSLFLPCVADGDAPVADAPL